MTQIEVVRPIDPASLAVSDSPVSIASILDKAVSGGMSAESLEKIVALYERVADRAAAQEFSSAMARFQATCPPIKKSSKANVVTKGGASYSYNYAELDTIAQHVRPLLSAEGLSYTWDSTEDKGLLSCTCTVRHVNGHSVAAKFSCSIDTAANMSGAQKSGGALTYARRQSLIQALGLTTTDPDNDAPPPPTINDHQVANLDALMDEVNADRAAFYKWFGVKGIADIPASRFKEAVAAMEKKRSQK